MADGSAASAKPPNFGPIEAKFIALLHTKLPPSAVENMPSPMLKGDAKETVSARVGAKRK